MNRRIVSILLVFCLTAGVGVAASDWQDNWGPAIGSELPELAVKDTEGNDRDIEDLTGDNEGLLIFFVRTSNW